MDLKIYTWGKGKFKRCPHETDANFNAAHAVDQYPKGFNLRKSNGKQKKFREGFMKIPKFAQFVDKVFDEVTNHPEWETISIYCEKGRHRSASAAELVARRLRIVGRRANVQHLCI